MNRRSNVFQLPEGRMLSYFGLVTAGSALDVPNAALGFTYYALWLMFLPSFPKGLRFFVASMAMSSSVFLAAKLLILKELCILCWSTHIINARLLWSAYLSFRSSGESAKQAEGKAKIKRV